MNEFIKLFPSFMIIYFEDNHNHFEAGLIDFPLLKQDASIYYEDIYLVDWYITTFLIKDNDLSNIIEQFNYLLDKHKTATPITIFFKRNSKYYLYVILKKYQLFQLHVLKKDVKNINVIYVVHIIKKNYIRKD